LRKKEWKDEEGKEVKKGEKAGGKK